MYDTWVAFVAASLLILIVPGPTLLVVVSYALRHGRRVIWPVATAVSAGHALAIGLAVWGLDALASLSNDYPSGAQLAASSYLAFLGVRQFRSRPTPGLGTLVPSCPPGRGIFPWFSDNKNIRRVHLMRRNKFAIRQNDICSGSTHSRYIRYRAFAPIAKLVLAIRVSEKSMCHAIERSAPHNVEDRRAIHPNCV